MLKSLFTKCCLFIKRQEKLFGSSEEEEEMSDLDGDQGNTLYPLDTFRILITRCSIWYRGACQINSHRRRRKSRGTRCSTWRRSTQTYHKVTILQKEAQRRWRWRKCPLRGSSPWNSWIEEQLASSRRRYRRRWGWHSYWSSSRYEGYCLLENLI